MNWGKGIVIAFIIFVTLILSVVFFSMTQDVNLVSEDYYKQEIEYQERIDDLKNTMALIEKPNLTKSGPSVITVTFPNEVYDGFKEGTILFFRPSNASRDFTIEISLDSAGQQVINMAKMKEGAWRAKMSWSSNDGKGYYDEFVVVR